MFRCLCGLVFVTGMIVNQSYAADLYVAPSGSDRNAGTLAAPFLTIAKARDVAKSLSASMTSDIVVHLRDGTYALSTPLTFDASHSGANGHDIIYQAYLSEKPVISGGRRVSGWTLHDPAKNIYRAPVGSTVAGRQLYINGQRGIRARSVDAAGWKESGTGYSCPAAVATWGNITAVEVVSRKEWKCHRGPVAAVSGGHAVMAQPYWANLHQQYDAPPAWVENAYELLDSDGEWYLNQPTGMLYYKPRAGEDMAKAEVILPVIEKLIDANGLKRVHFKGLTFADATWLRPNSAAGHPVLQADETQDGNGLVPGNLHFTACENLRFEANLVTRMGSTALRFSKGSRANAIVDSVFADVSGSGISLGNFDGDAQDTVGNVIHNNLIQQCGREFESAVGILIGYTQRTTVTHNTLDDLPYTGISFGYGWDKNKEAAQDCDIGYNRIENHQKTLRDGAGIYGLSNQPGTRVHHNYIRNAQLDYGGLYPDEGSSNSTWDFNVIDQSAKRTWLLIWTKSITNVTVQNNYTNCPTEKNNGTNCSVTNTTIVNGQNWPPAALAIIAGSGRLTAKSPAGPSRSQPAPSLPPR